MRFRFLRAGALSMMLAAVPGCVWAPWNEPINGLPQASDLPGGPGAGRKPEPGLSVGLPESEVVRDSLFESLRLGLYTAAQAQERLHRSERTYTTETQRLFADSLSRIPSQVLVRIASADSTAWSGSAMHPRLEGYSCVVSVSRGGPAPRINTLREKRPGHVAPGEVVCDGAVLKRTLRVRPHLSPDTIL